jgi:cytochrome oxidase Cu insertion factor (SCO1/SenC/PrrC family)
MFLTGTKPQIGALAKAGLKLTAVEVKPEERQSPEDLFVHSTIMVIVDKRGQLRGNYQTSGEDVDWAKSKQDILAAVRQLEREK